MFSDIWERTLIEMKAQVMKERENINGNKLVSEQNELQENWMGSQRLIKLLRSGLKIAESQPDSSSAPTDKSNIAAAADDCCDFDTKCKVVYGFEQILP